MKHEAVLNHSILGIKLDGPTKTKSYPDKTDKDTIKSDCSE